MTQSLPYHISVLLQESINALNIKSGGVYVDLTFGAGGHSKEIATRLAGKGILYAFDKDGDAEINAKNCFQVPKGVTFIFTRADYRYLINWLTYYKQSTVDGILADLGVSSHHFDNANRGFSIRFDAPLDMRMNRNSTITAAEVVNNYSEERLAWIIKTYGEMPQARKLANKIVKVRQEKRIVSTGDLLHIAEPFLKYGAQKRDAARLFQALRIEVNGELESLKTMLESTTKVLSKAGRLAIITYHSLEDRMVKNFMRAGNIRGELKKDIYGRTNTPLVPVGKFIIPSQKEKQDNPRCRSAKLRVAEKIQ